MFCKDCEFCYSYFTKWKIYINGDYRLRYRRLIDLTVRSPPPRCHYAAPTPRRHRIPSSTLQTRIERSGELELVTLLMNTWKSDMAFWQHTLLSLCKLVVRAYRLCSEIRRSTPKTPRESPEKGISVENNSFIQKVIITAFAIVRRNHRDRILDKVIPGPCPAVHWWQIYPGEATSGWAAHQTPYHYTMLTTILLYRNSSLNFALYHAVSLVLAFHWRQIYPSLGCHQDAFDRKILQHPQDCHRHHCGIMAINFISLKSYHSQPLSHNTFLSHNKTGLFKWHQSTKQANWWLKLFCIIITTIDIIIIPSPNLWVSWTISSPI